MNEDILIIIKLTRNYDSEFINFINSLNDKFSHLLLLDTNNYINNSLLPSDNNNIEILKCLERESGDYYQFAFSYALKKHPTIRAFVIVNQYENYSVDDIVKCSSFFSKEKIGVILGITSFCKDNFFNKFITLLTNLCFNRHFKQVLTNLFAIDAESVKKALKTPENVFKNTLGIIVYAVSQNILIQEVITNNKMNNAKFRDLGYSFGLLLPYFLKLIISYIIGLILFLIVFYYINSNNDLQAIVFTNILTGIITLIIHIFWNYKTYYKSNILSRNLISILKKGLKIVISGFFIYICYNLLDINLLLSKIVVDILLTFGIYIIFRNVGFRND